MIEYNGELIPDAKHPLYTVWTDMKRRCYNKNRVDYDSYGGRGITVCSEWIRSFHLFVSDMGDRPSGTTIDRIDNDKGYYKENCRWVTMAVQNKNQRQRKDSKRVVMYKDGVMHVIKKGGLKAFCRLMSLDPSAISRLLKGKCKKFKGWHGRYIEEVEL